MSNSVTGYVGNAKTNQNNRAVKGSKYKQKQSKGGKGKKSAEKPRAPHIPVFLYNSQCCGELAKKEPCIIDRGVKFHERKSSLGKWRCTKCRKACKVNRRLNKDNINPFRPVMQVVEAVKMAMLDTLLAEGAPASA